MRFVWTQPSLSRDFALLSAAIVFVLGLLSAWLTYTTYVKYSLEIEKNLDQEAKRIERVLVGEMQSANYLLSALSRQLAQDPMQRELVSLARTLKSFDSKGNLYSIFSWVSDSQRVVVSSNRGVLNEPIDISDRDYVKKAIIEPWRMQIGRPIEGRVSGRWVIPVSMGVSDNTGRFLGTMMISIDIASLVDEIRDLVASKDVNFAILSHTLVPLASTFQQENIDDQPMIAELNEIDFSIQPQGYLHQQSTYFGRDRYSYYMLSAEVPYVIYVSHAASQVNSALFDMLWARLFLVTVMAVLLVLLLWLVRSRMIKPLSSLGDDVQRVIAGQTPLHQEIQGPIELQLLAQQLHTLLDVMEERKRIEDEQRYKLSQLRNEKVRLQLEGRMLHDWIVAFSRQMQPLLSHIFAASQILRDQLYGAIENRKYRQYIQECYSTGEALLRNNPTFGDVGKFGLMLPVLENNPPAPLSALLEHAFSNTKSAFGGWDVQLQLKEASGVLFKEGEMRGDALFSEAFFLMAAQEYRSGTATCEVLWHSNNAGEKRLVILFREGNTAFTPQLFQHHLMANILGQQMQTTDMYEQRRVLVALLIMAYCAQLEIEFYYDMTARSPSFAFVWSDVKFSA